MFELGCHPIDRATALADNTLAILEYDHAIAEIHVGAANPFGSEYRTREIIMTHETLLRVCGYAV